ncbi:MAG TPA: TolC family protein [Candidatus Polarisedimenticolia bacterium]|jgi:outer membrane protein TolC
MTLSRRVLVLALGLAAPALSLAADQGQTPPAEAGPPPINLSLSEAVKLAFENSLEIRVLRYTPQIRENDIQFQEAVFDPALTATVYKADNSRPSQNVFDIGTSGTIVSIDSTVNDYAVGFIDRLRWGASYSANLGMTRLTSSSRNAVFPTTYQTSFELAYNQSLLRNFGPTANKTGIVIAQNNEQISRSQFRQQVLDILKITEEAYWELVYARQDLEVKNESLRLAQELLKLNKIKVQVGTLPPIEITTAEAEVANREQGVIVAENAVQDAEDVLRRIVNMPKSSSEWLRPILTTDEPTYFDRPFELEKELQTANDRRPDLEQARLDTKNAEVRLGYDRNQMKWDLNFRATYTLLGLSGDSKGLFGDVAVFCADDGVDGVAATGDPGEGDGICESSQPDTGATPAGPGETLTFASAQFAPTQNENFLDALEFIRDRDFESWSVSLALGIPIGNRAAEATYTSSRLAKEQSDIAYERVRLIAEVQVRTAARAILTSKRRIDAADKNVELQKKKVEAEQKKFENGMSTSFQVLTFQNDLITALGTRNRALVDYRRSVTALELAKGTLDEYLQVSIR